MAQDNSDKAQREAMGHCSSPPKALTSRVPRGSRHSPLPFNITEREGEKPWAWLPNEWQGTILASTNATTSTTCPVQSFWMESS